MTHSIEDVQSYEPSAPKRFNLSKSTFHYKYYRFLRNFFEEDGVSIPFYKTATRRDFTPRSLCSYFWATVFMTVLFPLTVILFSIAGVVALITLPIWIWFVLRARKFNAEKTAYYMGDGPKPTRNYWGVKTDKPPKGDNLLISWFKAYKNKHCPLVTLVD